MDFKAEHYFRAAIQRMEQAHYLYREGRSFALSIYVGGVAVECMLRAFKLLREPSFDERHHLLRLLAHLKRLTGFQKTKGNYLKALAFKFLRSAESIITKGVLQWPFSGN